MSSSIAPFALKKDYYLYKIDAAHMNAHHLSQSVRLAGKCQLNLQAITTT